MRNNHLMTDENDPAPPAPVAAAGHTVRVRIDAGGREIELETSGLAATIDALALTAFALWKATGDTAHAPEARSLFGLVASERSAERGASSTMDWPVETPR
jgi:hypothetical protein